MKKSTKKGANPADLSRLVTWFDGYASLSVVDPQRMEKVVKRNSDDQEISWVWTQVRRDINDIAVLPNTSREIVRLSKRLNIFRQVLMYVGLAVFGGFLLLSDLFGGKSQGLSGTPLFFVVFIAAYFAVFGVYFWMNRKLTRLVVEYYDKHSGEVAKQRRHIKQVNQRLIDKLAMVIRARRLDPEKYKFDLAHKDYANITIVGENKNSLYQAIVKGKKLDNK